LALEKPTFLMQYEFSCSEIAQFSHFFTNLPRLQAFSVETSPLLGKAGKRDQSTSLFLQEPL
jgi:hypothetical protein